MELRPINPKDVNYNKITYERLAQEPEHSWPVITFFHNAGAICVYVFDLFN